ncbi:MAG TPA: ABC transporter permease [Baekduia sp.]
MSASFVAKRIGMLVPTWLGISIIAFSLIHLIPGDPATVILGIKATPDQRQALLHQLGLDQPLPHQFVTWLGNVLHGDLGTSVINGTSVTSTIWDRAAPSFELVVFAFVLAVVFGIPLGIVSATRNGKLAELFASSGSLLGMSIPTFVLGSLLIVLGSRWLGGIDMVGYVPMGEDPVRNLTMMFWPALTLALSVLAIVVRYTRTSMLSTLSQDYITTARAMGVPHRTVIYRNGLRNALVPVIGAVGAQLAYLVGGAVIVESVFAIPGIGTLTLDSIDQRDYPVLQGVVLIVATGVIVVNILIDILYRVVDPRMGDA